MDGKKKKKKIISVFLFIYICDFLFVEIINFPDTNIKLPFSNIIKKKFIKSKNIQFFFFKKKSFSHFRFFFDYFVF